jgi:ankyrin repeat protein
MVLGVNHLIAQNPSESDLSLSLRRIQDSVNESFINRKYLKISKLASQLDDCFSKALNRSDLDSIKAAVEKVEERIQDQEKKGDYPNSLLYDLIFRHHGELAKKLIHLGISSIHSKNDYCERTPLHLACYRGEYDLVVSLVDQGVDLNPLECNSSLGREDYNKTTPLGKCLEAQLSRDTFLLIKYEEHKKIFHFLLDRGANPRIGHVFQEPLFNCCIRFGKKWYERLIPSANLEAEEPVCHKRPIHMAVIRQDMDLVKILIEKKVDVHALCRESFFKARKVSPLHIAAVKQNIPLINTLMDAGASPNQKAENPFYGVIGLPEELTEQPPLTPYMMAVDLNLHGSIDAMCHHPRFPKLDSQFPGKRDWKAGTLEEMMRKGYSSTPLRLKTEEAKRKATPVREVWPLRIYTVEEKSIPILQEAFSKSPDYLDNIKDIWSPLMSVINLESQKNQNFSIFFLDCVDFQGSPCYNADTGDEIILLTLLESGREIWPVFLHEATHKIADLIYGNPNPPDHSPFHQALKEDLLQINEDHCHAIVQCSFKRVKEDYPELMRPADYLARIPEVAARIAMSNPHWDKEDVDEIMTKSLPHLYPFFKDHFLLACQEYIEKGREEV